MQNLKTKKTKLGFTLMELMIVIAIMGVLFGVGAPATKAIQSKLEWKKANGIAKEIFMVAQNQATHMKSNDALGNFSDQVTKKTSQKVVTKPSDYNKANGKYKNLYYITNTDSGAMSYIVPNITQQSITGSYLIEVNPNSGDVYGVFYSETLSTAQLLSAYEAGTKSSSGAALTEDVFRPEENRKKYVIGDTEHMIGYYGGSEAGISGDQAHDPTIKAYNREQLYVKVNIPYTSASAEDFNIDFIINDEHGNRIVRSGTANESGNWNKPIITTGDKNTIDVYLILDDSINSTSHKFSDLNKGLTAGDDITITAQATYVYDSKYITTKLSSATASVTVNSLFADGTDISDDPAKNSNIKVSNCRHLYNICNIRNTDTWAKANREVRTTQLVTVNQTKDIDFSETTVESKICPCMGTNGLSFNAKSHYDKLENYFIFGTNATTWSADSYPYTNSNNTYNGHGNEIQNLIIKSSAATGSGLFGKFNAKITDVHLRNIRVTSSSERSDGRRYVGGLIGWAGGKTHVSKCGVYCSAYKEIDKFPYVGNEFDYSNYYIEGRGDVGGLVGRIENGGIIEDSFAAIDVRVEKDLEKNQGSDYIKNTPCNSFGGLVGRVLANSSGKCSSVIKNCYSSGNVEGTFDVGGVVGVCYGKVESCYTTSTIKPIYTYTNSDGASLIAGGIIGKLQSPGSVKNCIFYGSFEKHASTVEWKNQNVGVICDRVRAKSMASSITGCKCLVADNYNDDLATTSDASKETGYGGATKCTYSDLVDGVSNSENNSYSYKKKLTKFPYKFLNAMGNGATVNYHYGNWYKPDEPKIYPKLVYYEIYKKGSETAVGFNTTTVVLNETNETVALPQLYNQSNIDAGWSVYQAGYGIIATDSHAFNLSRNGSTKEKVDLGTAVKTFELNGTDINLYSLNSTGYGEKDSSNKATFYDGLKVYDGKTSDGTQYYYNGDVANQVAQDTKPATPTSVEVRTAKQFNTLGNSNNSYLWKTIDSKKITYSQTLDINYSTYDGGTSLTNAPIGTSKIAFTNSYNGHGNEVVSYNLQSTVTSDNKYIGIFGQVGSGATISNCHFVASDSGYITSNYPENVANATGGVVGYLNGGTLTNTSISGYTITAQGSSSQKQPSLLGGLVGVSTGSITKCSAVNKKICAQPFAIDKDVRGWYVGVAGLVGSKLSGTLSSCYCGGEISYSMTKIHYRNNYEKKSYSAGIAGSEINNVGASSISKGISGCYSYCTFSVYVDKTDNKSCWSHYNYAGCQDSNSKGSNSYTTDVFNPSYDSAIKNRITNETTNSAVGVSLTQLARAGEDAGARPSEENTHPWSTGLVGKQYPNMCFVKTGDGSASDAYVHYGDWIPAVEYVGIVQSYYKSWYGWMQDIHAYKIENGKVTYIGNDYYYEEGSSELKEVIGNIEPGHPAWNHHGYYYIFWNVVNKSGWTYEGTQSGQITTFNDYNRTYLLNTGQYVTFKYNGVQIGNPIYAGY